MSLVINTNSAASLASMNLNKSNDALQRSLGRLSSGSKITNPSDDAGGLAVSMKMTAKLHRTDKVNDNLQNAISFLQTQDGGLETATKILDRMSELKVMHSDVTKSADDKDNYQTEFAELVNQMQVLDDAEFNGVNLFEGDGVTASNLEVSMVEDGSSTMTVSQSQLNDTGTAVNTITSGTLDSLSVGQFTDAIAEVATQRATNGAQQSRLQFASEMLEVNRQNLEAANSRIVDTDIARESTEYARANILVQSGTAMLAQANQSSQVALRLLG